jgi:hypothetical protein
VEKNIAMENGPFVDDLATEHSDLPVFAIYSPTNYR